MDSKPTRKKVLIIGAGPAGLATAYELVRQSTQKRFQIDIFEIDKQVGGLAKTLVYKGYRFDLGGHRFYTKFPEIDEFYKHYLKGEMLVRDRLSRIYYSKKYYDYPLSVVNAVTNLGILRATKIVFSWLVRQFKPHAQEVTFDQWVSNRFGDELFKTFFKSYTEKVWGVPTSELSADWAAQRIQNFDLFKAMINALFKLNVGAKTVITKFYYPKFGPGMLYDKLKVDLEKAGVKIHLHQRVEGFTIKKNKIETVKLSNVRTGEPYTKQADIVVSTIPFAELVPYLEPPSRVAKAVHALQFRHFITVNLIIRANPFPDQWIYIHDPMVKVGRVQNFRNWSPYMVRPGSKNTPIGMEYFCSEGDELWEMNDSHLLALAKDEIVKISLAKSEEIVDGFAYRVKNAYPLYNFNYQKPLELCKSHVQLFKNLYLCGRGGLFRYNNQDHSILSGFYVARNIVKGRDVYDVWTINEASDYLETKNN